MSICNRLWSAMYMSYALVLSFSMNPDTTSRQLIIETATGGRNESPSHPKIIPTKQQLHYIGRNKGQAILRQNNALVPAHTQKVLPRGPIINSEASFAFVGIPKKLRSAPRAALAEPCGIAGAHARRPKDEYERDLMAKREVAMMTVEAKEELGGPEKIATKEKKKGGGYLGVTASLSRGGMDPFSNC